MKNTVMKAALVTVALAASAGNAFARCSGNMTIYPKNGDAFQQNIKSKKIGKHSSNDIIATDLDSAEIYCSKTALAQAQEAANKYNAKVVVRATLDYNAKATGKTNTKFGPYTVNSKAVNVSKPPRALRKQKQKQKPSRVGVRTQGNSCTFCPN